MAAQEIPLAGFRARLLSRNSVAEGTMAFHFARPIGFSFKAGQAADLTLLDPPETDSEGNIRRSRSIAAQAVLVLFQSATGGRTLSGNPPGFGKDKPEFSARRHHDGHGPVRSRMER